MRTSRFVSLPLNPAGTSARHFPVPPLPGATRQRAPGTQWPWEMRTYEQDSVSGRAAAPPRPPHGCPFVFPPPAAAGQDPGETPGQQLRAPAPTRNWAGGGRPLSLLATHTQLFGFVLPQILSGGCSGRFQLGAEDLGGTSTAPPTWGQQGPSQPRAAAHPRGRWKWGGC